MRNHRRYLGPVVFLALFGTGCSKCSSEADGPAPIASVGAASGFSPGDQVVAEYARAAFFEGTVSVVGRESLSIVEQGVGTTREVDAANVYRLESGANKKWSKGVLAICQMGDHRWLACRVQGTDGDKVAVVDEKGEKASLATGAMIEPSPVTKLNLENVFERVDKARSFAKGVLEAGALHRPADWEPRAGEGVIVRSGGAYVSAVVHEARRNLLLLQVNGQGEKPKAVAPEDVWPQPPVDASTTIGGYACVRPPAGEYVWGVVRIDQHQDAKVVVSTPAGDERSVDAKDLLPFESRKPEADQ